LAAHFFPNANRCRARARAPRMRRELTAYAAGADATSPASARGAHVLSPLLEFCRLVAIVPPGFGGAARVAWLGRGPAEHVPIGEPVRGLVPVRNPIAAAADHPVERPAGHRQALTAIGGDDLVDERIDDRIGNAGEI